MEENPFEAVSNNIFGTLNCVLAANKCKVQTFVLISTDKAVRPTNIMGATKRFAELILQSLSDQKEVKESTKISIVRFGNVLGSSSSVVPLFREQIKKGGPVTVTDPEIVRYFMSIPEASNLVLQSGAMMDQGSIYLLDMGEPVNIQELAIKLISLHGKEACFSDPINSNQIQIIHTGLRPGEKLYEELLINKESIPTKHEKIMIIDENFLEWRKVQDYLKNLSLFHLCLLYTSPSPRDATLSRLPASA